MGLTEYALSDGKKKKKKKKEKKGLNKIPKELPADAYFIRYCFACILLLITVYLKWTLNLEKAKNNSCNSRGGSVGS